MNDFDLKALKARWRALAKARGIDAADGATAYQVASFHAEQAKATHRERQARLVEAHAFTHPPHGFRLCHQWHPRLHRWTLYRWRYSNWDDGCGMMDMERVDTACSRFWFVAEGMWTQEGDRYAGPVVRPTEAIGVYRVLHHAKRLLKMRFLRQMLSPFERRT